MNFERFTFLVCATRARRKRHASISISIGLLQQNVWATLRFVKQQDGFGGISSTLISTRAHAMGEIRNPERNRTFFGRKRHFLQLLPVKINVFKYRCIGVFRGKKTPPDILCGASNRPHKRWEKRTMVHSVVCGLVNSTDFPAKNRYWWEELWALNVSVASGPWSMG